MTKVHLIRWVALGGAGASAVAYVGFLMAGLKGGGPHLDHLWKTVFFAPAHVLLGWAIFSLFGVTAFVFRGKLADRLLLVSAGLVGLPFLWAVALRYLYYDMPPGVWPTFQDESWRWFATYIYAELALGMLLGFIGLATVTLKITKTAKT